MLAQRLRDMGVTRLIAELSIIKTKKFEELEALGVDEAQALKVLERDLMLKEITDLILAKTLENRVKNEVKRGIFNQ